MLSVGKHSTLTGWFLANQKFPSARAISYLEFPDKTKRGWKQRMKGRVYSAHPSEGERFYLRILLNHVTGCTSFQAIRTLPDGTVCGTFKEAACHRGLLEDDNEYYLCWLWLLHGICLHSYVICSLPFYSIMNHIILQHYGKSINMLF